MYAPLPLQQCPEIELCMLAQWGLKKNEITFVFLCPFNFSKSIPFQQALSQFKLNYFVFSPQLSFHFLFRLEIVNW